MRADRGFSKLNHNENIRNFQTSIEKKVEGNHEFYSQSSSLNVSKSED
jgi:hypothetical protein